MTDVVYRKTAAMMWADMSAWLLRAGLAIGARDYLTSVKDGASYSWPYSDYGQHVVPRGLRHLLIDDDTGHTVWRVSSAAAH